MIGGKEQPTSKSLNAARRPDVLVLSIDPRPSRSRQPQPQHTQSQAEHGRRKDLEAVLPVAGAALI